MSNFRRLIILIWALLVAAPALAERSGLGRVALPAELAAWDTDIGPGGVGMPYGSGGVDEGEAVFAEMCAGCHGDFAEGLNDMTRLAGGVASMGTPQAVKSVGSYWPYLTTVFDYTRRTMPLGDAGTLSADDTYAVMAFILYSNDLVDDGFILSQDNLADFEMPNADGFVPDDRADTEYPDWSVPPCMSDCREVPRILSRASALDVTPDEADADGQDHVPD